MGSAELDSGKTNSSLFATSEGSFSVMFVICRLLMVFIFAPWVGLSLWVLVFRNGPTNISYGLYIV